MLFFLIYRNKNKKTVKIKLLFLFFLIKNQIFAQQIETHATINSIGYELTLPPNFDVDSTATTTVRYRISGQNWQDGFPPTRFSGGIFRGSLFQLEAATDYNLEISVVDSMPFFEKIDLEAQQKTRKNPIILPTNNVKWVSPNGLGTTYSAVNPGNLQKILADGLTCGTTVFLKGGDYFVGDLMLNLTENCTENTPILLQNAPNETAILDGGSYENYTWFQGVGDTNIWWTNLPAELDFNALCLVDGERMYPYGFLTASNLDPTYPNLWDLGYDLSGFYRNKQHQIFVKTFDHQNINGKKVILGKQFNCLTINGNNHDNFLQIKGLHFKHFGKGVCSFDFFGNPAECFPSNTISLIDVNQAIIDSCRFEFTNFPITFSGNCNENLVQNCQIFDQTGWWSHAAFKRTRDVVSGLFDDGKFGTFGRYLENAGIHFRPNTGQTVRGNIIRNNYVFGVVGGIAVGFDNGSFSTECDIYNNTISSCFDGLDAIFNQKNTRIWGNDIQKCPVGTSLILPCFGPVFIFRNVYHHLSQRKNHQTDPNFLDCNNVETHQSWATALKLNAGGENLASPGSIYFFHNTLYNKDSLGFNLYFWNPTWKKFISQNNIYYSTAKSNFLFDGVQGATNYNFESSRDNVVNPKTGILGIVRPNHGQINDCLENNNLLALENTLKNATTSPTVFWKNGLSEKLDFVDAEMNNFNLTANSVLIDKGLAINGFNQIFFGNAPDLGAFESPYFGVSTRDLLEKNEPMHVFPNPFHDFFQVEINPENGVFELNLINLQGEIIWKQEVSETKLDILTVEIHENLISNGIYFLEIKSRTGARWTKVLKM
jgi:hypothetical protein